jgi:ABC-type multidrug transport system fused ATPase/permease subunit
MDFWSSIWDFIGFFFWTFVFVAYLFALFAVIADIFRDSTLNGWAKAAWLIFLIFVPILTALVYVIARGRGMAERQVSAGMAQKRDTDEYIRSVASANGPSQEIAQAKQLLDSGAITQGEYAVLKDRALGNSQARSDTV